MRTLALSTLLVAAAAPTATAFVLPTATQHAFNSRQVAHQQRCAAPAPLSMVLLPHVPPKLLESAAINSGGFALLIASGKAGKMLTSQGCAHACALGTLLWYTLGWEGWLLTLSHAFAATVCYDLLLAGSLVTKVKMAEKSAAGIAEGRGGKRGPENVWGSAATGALCALATLIWPSRTALLRLGYVASLATKLSDTVASEIGKAYGKTTYLITTLKAVPAGTEGAVSLEGTLAGVVGSLVIALFGYSTGMITRPAVGICLLAAFVATNVESLLGATTQGKTKWLTNEVINFINTTVGAAVAMGLAVLLKR
eukprot:19701-Heterococcus_DN1.PRE.2